MVMEAQAMTHTPVQIVLIPVPESGSPKYAKPQKPNYLHHKAERRWPLTQPIPKPQIDRQLIERMREQAKRAIDAHRPQIEALMQARV
jgi:hypothetical protein